MAEFNISGRLTIKSQKKQFKEAFGATLRVYKGKQFADDDATLASIRVGDVKGGELKCAGNLKVGNFENKMKELFGVTVQVATKDDSALADNDITIAAAGR